MLKSQSLPLVPIERRNLTEQVTQQLREAILKGKLKPGESIVEEDVAILMKTSRGPVRDAMTRLEHEGLIIREANRRSAVANMSVQDVEEVCSLRASLEMLAFRFMMTVVTEEEIVTLEEAAGKLSSRLKTGCTIEEAVDLDLKIHEKVVTLSRHSRIISFWQSLKSQIWFLIFSNNVYQAGGISSDVDRSHGSLIEAIRARSLERGEEILKDHLEKGYERMLSRYLSIKDATQGKQA